MKIYYPKNIKLILLKYDFLYSNVIIHRNSYSKLRYLTVITFFIVNASNGYLHRKKPFNPVESEAICGYSSE